MNGRVFSVILLPTSDCNVACEYCFERKEPHRLSLALLPLLTRRLLDHLEHEGIEECEIYWQGGEAMIMGPAWFVRRWPTHGSRRCGEGSQIHSLSAD